MEVTRTFIAHPCELELLDFLRRRLRDGEIFPWIHEANVYGCDPVAISAQFAPATAANGKPGWYFLCTPQQKNRRIKRTAGPGTWKGERGCPLVSVSGGGVHETVGWTRTFSYLIKTGGKEDNATRLGWIMLEIKLADGTATCLCKIYRSPRIRHDQLSKALNLSLEAPTMSPSSSGATLGPATQMASGPMNVQTPAAAEVMAPPMSRSSSGATLGPALQMASGVMDDQTAAAVEVMAPPMPPSSSGATLGPATQMASGPMNVQTAAAAEVMATTSGLSQTPHAGSPTVALNVLSSASTSGPIDVLPAAAAAGHTAFSSETSPSTPKRWVTVQISDSPTRANDKSLARPKRVYSMILPAEEGSDSSAKKLKPVDCKGWLTIEPVPCTDSAIA